jgi:hypothetical protein
MEEGNEQQMKPFAYFRSRWGFILMLLILVSATWILVLFKTDDGPASSPRSSKNRLKTYPQLVLWSSDFHISPVADLKSFLSRFKVKIIDKSLSGHCHLTQTCATNLKVITQENGIHLDPCPNDLRREFYEAYKDDPELAQVDAFLCLHATSMCELFMPFGKPLIVITSTRYEIGRHEDYRWKTWNDNLQRISNRPENTIAANNYYDLEYLKYFTSLSNEKIEYLPNLCQYVNQKYNPTKITQFLLAPSRGIHPNFQNDLFRRFKAYQKTATFSFEISPLREVYPHFEYSDLVAHPAIILLPYQISFMSFFEYYQMEIPLLVPSIDLLAEYHYEYHVLSERTWYMVLNYGAPPDHSPLPRHANCSAKLRTDPNNDRSLQAIKDWISLADFYQFPHVIQFHSWSELFRIISTNSMDDWKDISMKMKSFNRKLEEQQEKKWIDILERIVSWKQNTKILKSYQTLDINSALFMNYGYRLSGRDCFSQV